MSGELLYTWMSGQPQLPSLEEFAVLASTAGAAVLVAVPSALLLAKVFMGDFFHVELHRCARTEFQVGAARHRTRQPALGTFL